MTITEASEPANVTIALEFLKPFKSSNTTTFDLRPEGEGTNVTWRMVGPRTFMIRVMGIFKSMDSMVGKDFEKGLERLRRTSNPEPTLRPRDVRPGRDRCSPAAASRASLPGARATVQPTARRKNDESRTTCVPQRRDES